MKERIIEFLKAENKSSAQFAEEIGVQASSISHIISGRNNPSLDFVLKMLDKYKFLSTEWLLFGKGTMYRDSRMQTLFDQDLNNPVLDFGKQEKLETAKDKPATNEDVDFSQPPSADKSSRIERIIWFYSDQSFKEFFPKQ
jgi:transcriptional regulator with XRE-family HTH domain